MKNLWTVITLFFALEILSGCSVTPSTNVATPGVFANYTLSSSDNKSVLCSAAFKVGGDTGTYLELENGDTVTCNGQAMSRIQDQITKAIYYQVTLPAQPGAIYMVAFARPKEGVYKATVELPEPIQLQSPYSNAQIKKGTEITARWIQDRDPTTQVIGVLSYSTPAPIGSGNSSPIYKSSLSSGRTPDSGTLTWPSTDSPSQPTQLGNLPTKLTLTREKTGTFSPGLTGNFSAVQSLSINVFLVD